jgi:hypothetical protein
MTLIKLHDKFLWIEKLGLITKEVRREITRLHATGLVPVFKSVKNKDVMELTRATFDQRDITMNTIENPIVRYAYMVIRYKIYYSNKENFVFSREIHVAYEMVEKGEDCDLCDFIL